MEKRTLSLTDATARIIYKKGCAEIKEILEESFPANFFKGNIFERLKTFNDCCLEVGTTEEEFNKKFLHLGLDTDTIGYERCKIIVKAVNEGWKPDFKNSKQLKYYIWWDCSSGGFSYGGYLFTNAATDVGVRLCVETQSKAEFIGKQFTSEFKSFLM